MSGWLYTWIPRRLDWGSAQVLEPVPQLTADGSIIARRWLMNRWQRRNDIGDDTATLTPEVPRALALYPASDGDPELRNNLVDDDHGLGIMYILNELPDNWLLENAGPYASGAHAYWSAECPWVVVFGHTWGEFFWHYAEIGHPVTQHHVDGGGEETYNGLVVETLDHQHSGIGDPSVNGAVLGKCIDSMDQVYDPGDPQVHDRHVWVNKSSGAEPIVYT